MHPLLRMWFLLLVGVWVAMVIVPHTNADWWYAATQRPLKTQWDIARTSILCLLDITVFGSYFWCMRKKAQNRGE